MDTIQSLVNAGAHALLVTAHPGHELRVYGWLELVRPRVFILTDGSGQNGQPRLEPTSAILRRVGASRGNIFGALTERELYDALIRKDHARFVRLVEELSEALADPGVAYVVGDASEGYSPGHEVCRLLIDAAVAVADQNRAVPLGNFAFRLYGSPVPPSAALAGDLLQLDDAALARKIAAGLGYLELATEVHAALQAFGQDAFRNEYLPPVSRPLWDQIVVAGKPGYEVHGEKEVAAGRFREVLRYEEHLRPLMAALPQAGVQRNQCAS